MRQFLMRGASWPQVLWSAAGAEGPGSEATAATGSADPSASEGGDGPSGAEAGADGDGEGASADPAAKTPSPKPTSGDWRDRRIATLTGRLKELQEKGATPAPSVPEPPKEGEAHRLSEADVERRAEALVQAREFNRRCDETALAGKSKYGDQLFAGRVNQLVQLIDKTDVKSVQSYNAFLDAAIETGEGARLIYELGADPDEAERIMALPPARMAVALTKLAAAAPQEISGVPKPVTPVGSSRGSRDPIDPTDTERSDKLSTEDWMRRREAQIAAMEKAR